MSLRNCLHAHLGQAGLRAQLVTATVAQLVADEPVHTTELPQRVLCKLGDLSSQAVSSTAANLLQVGEQWVMLTHKEIREGLLTGGEGGWSYDPRRGPR